VTRYVALLRGINVGGRNKILMAELTTCFEDAGFEDVTTYIQSGNVLFSSPKAPAGTLTARLESVLAKAFDYRASVVLRTTTQLRKIVAGAPAGFGGDPARYRYDVLFLKEPLTAAEVIATGNVKEGVDEAHAGTGVVYYSRLDAKAAQSRLSRLAGMPIYQNITARNWNTTTKLLRKAEETTVR
jgi:uncharacterized protein (DUF1697 family)